MIAGLSIYDCRSLHISLGEGVVFVAVGTGGFCVTSAEVTSGVTGKSDCSGALSAKELNRDDGSLSISGS
jgi:hypothetical protein